MISNAAKQAYNQGYYAENQDKLLAQKKASNFRNRESRRVKQKAYYHANREQCLATGELKKYGLTQSDIAAMHTEQNGLCECCETPISLIRGSENVRCIDHDHAKQKGEPGFIRGLVCCLCNVGLGAFADSPATLRRAALYLEKNATHRNHSDA